MIDRDLGQMFLVFNHALVVRSSSEILFFKIMWDEMEQKKRWQLYKVLPHRGFLSFMNGNIRIQVITDEKIYFYLIDKETFMPTLENVMFNYMGCN